MPYMSYNIYVYICVHICIYISYDRGLRQHPAVHKEVTLVQCSAVAPRSAWGTRQY